MVRELSKEWKVQKPLPKKIIKEHQQIPEVILQLLYNREIFSIRDLKKEKEKKIEEFLDPSYENLFDPFLMKDLKKAVLRIKKALKNKEKIAIFGDYDADGVTATALLYEVFNFLGQEVVTYIPHRDKEGYGLNSEAIKKIAKKKIKLLITIDCGIRNIKEVEEAKKLGMDVIITDHHEVPRKIKNPRQRRVHLWRKKSKIKNRPKDLVPRSLAVINPKQENCKYPFKQLAGVGVAFKLSQGLLKGIHKSETFLKWLLDLVVIGTIGDCVPLISENRILVKFGMLVFKKTRRIGILELKKTIRNGKENDIAFYLAPRLNAAGRMDHANWAFMLLITRSRIEAFKLINKIEQLNKKRREETDRVLREAKGEFGFLSPSQKIIILAKENWPSAISGIVAGRLAEEYQRPALVIENKGELSKGSARSYQGFNIVKALEKLSHLFKKVGGHKEAAGFIYETENHEEIVRELTEIASRKIKEIRKIIPVDLEINTEDLNHEFYKNLKMLEPFGASNPDPVFLIRRAKILEKRHVGLNDHLKIRFLKNCKRMNAIAFNRGDLENEFEIEGYVDFIFKLGENFYLGVSTVQLEILDLKASKRRK